MSIINWFLHNASVYRSWNLYEHWHSRLPQISYLEFSVVIGGNPNQFAEEIKITLCHK